MKSKDQATMVISYPKESSNLTGQGNFSNCFKNQIVKLFAMIESIQIAFRNQLNQINSSIQS